jgi:gluconolactonase
LAFDSKGRLISTQVTPGKARVGVIYPKGSETVLTDNFEGSPYNRPNDLVIDRKDGIYFTEFPFPVPATPGSALPGIYYLPAGGKPMRVADAFEPTVIDRPNGIMLSPDEKTLYIGTNSEYMLAFDVLPDGKLQNRRNFGRYEGIPKDPPWRGLGADGMAVDSTGNIYAATTVGVQVFSPTGQHLGTIPTSRRAQNAAFGGPDRKTLYITAGGVIFKVPMIAQGYKGRAR